MTNEPSSHRLRVMLVDDHEVVRSGIKSLLHATDDISVVAEAASVAEAVRFAAAAKPDQRARLSTRW